MDKQRIYKIDHYYNMNHDEQCVFVKTKIEIEIFIQILGTISFKFEELVIEGESLEEEHIVPILEKFYDVQDITKECQKYLPYTQLKNRHDWSLTNTFEMPDGTEIVQIDLYTAREVCCGSEYKKLMEKRLPASQEFEEAIRNLKKFYNKK